MIIGFALAAVPVVPIYAQAAYQSEQISQLLFGERMIILTKKKKDWLYVRCEWDGYEGWVKKGQVQMISERTYKRKLNALSLSARDKVLLPEGAYHLSPGSSLFLLKGRRFEWDETMIFKGKKQPLRNLRFEETAFVNLCHSFIGTPYLWGGRSRAGIDCSGLSQVAFKLFGVSIPRDASQQAEKGRPVDFLQSAKTGDLAFFDNEEGQINHVGILLGNNQIIHSSEFAGGTVLDYIDNGGIINRKRKLRTHSLRMIKRFFPEPECAD